MRRTHASRDGARPSGIGRSARARFAGNGDTFLCARSGPARLNARIATGANTRSPEIGSRAHAGSAAISRSAGTYASKPSGAYAGADPGAARRRSDACIRSDTSRADAAADIKRS